MATQQQTVDYILDQLTGAGPVRVHKMFGEYALYCHDKVVGLVCDDQLYIKITSISPPYLGAEFEAPPYPGAKPYLAVPEEHLDDAAWLSRFVADTAAVLPAPKPKTPKPPRGGSRPRP